MKSEFSKTWNSSKQPRKQVKFRANAPNHIKRTLMGCTLDKPLRAKYGMRNIEVRKGDEVKVMRGKFKGKQGKVGDVEIKDTRVQIEGIQRSKAGGEKLITWFNPSNIKIIILNTDDKRRMKRNTKISKVEEKKVEVKAETKTSEKKEVKTPVKKTETNKKVEATPSVPKEDKK